MTETVAVLDFETTGTTPQHGARATEIAVVRVREGRVVDHYSSLMRSGVRVPAFIQQLTGITDEMLRDAPPADAVMREVLAFTRGCPLVAHNAAFDRAFWHAEIERAGGAADPAQAAFACTVRLSRRLHPHAPSHRLQALAAFHGIAPQGRAHRALADALTTAELLLRLQREAAARLAAGAGAARDGTALPVPVSHALLCELQQVPGARVQTWLAARAGGRGDGGAAQPATPGAAAGTASRPVWRKADKGRPGRTGGAAAGPTQGVDEATGRADSGSGIACGGESGPVAAGIPAEAALGAGATAPVMPATPAAAMALAATRTDAGPTDADPVNGSGSGTGTSTGDATVAADFGASTNFRDGAAIAGVDAVIDR